MSEPIREPDTGPSRPPGARAAPGMPRWVKITLIVAGALIALFLVLKLTGSGGGHGPGRHMGSGAEVSPLAGPSGT